LEQLTRGNEVDDDEVEPMIDLADIWIPRDGKIYTFPVERRGQFLIKSQPVAVMDWEGPNHGPYHLLGFNDVPENIMPTSPASHLSSLARLANNLMRKGKRQAMNQKRIHTYTPAGAQDAERVQKASDGEWVQVNNVQEIGTVDYPGADPGNMALSVNIVDMYDRFAGNLTAMLGLARKRRPPARSKSFRARCRAKKPRCSTACWTAAAG
jgi:hypothetical protein